HEHQDSESLWQRLAPRLSGMTQALIVRGTTGRDWLGLRLEEAGLAVQRLALYERLPARWDAAQAATLAQALGQGPATFLLTSAEGVDAVYANITRLGLQDAWDRSRFVVVHERIASRLQLTFKVAGMMSRPVVKICQPHDDAIFQTINAIASLSESS